MCWKLIFSFCLLFALSAYSFVLAKSETCPSANYLTNKLNKNYLLRVELPTGIDETYDLRIKSIDQNSGTFTYQIGVKGDKPIIDDGVGKIQFKFFRFTLPIVVGDKLLAVYDCNGVLNDDGTVLSKCIVIERKLRNIPLCNQPPTAELIAQT